MAEYRITSRIDGRIRLRHGALRGEETAERARALAASLPGANVAAVNRRAGSLLLEYDSEQVDQEGLSDLLRRMGELLGSETEAVVSGKKERRRCPLLGGVSRAQAVRFVNRGMLTTLGASLAFLLAGRGRGHVVAGGIFLALNVAHLYTYRKTL